MKVSDYITDYFVEKGLSDVFIITGGGSMHLNNSFAENKNLNVFCFHHEQSASIAAEGYFRVKNNPAILNVTSGPGGINALNGVFGAYVDSQAMIVISGQVKLSTCLSSYKTPLRQLGDQETNIVPVVKSMTKYAVMIKNKTDIKKILDKAYFLATNGRPGPVWIDIPLDIQSADVNPNKLKGWNKSNLKSLFPDKSINKNTKVEIKSFLKNDNSKKITEFIKTKLHQSKKPVILLGNGVRISNSINSLLRLINILKIPVLTGWNAHDIILEDNPYYCGRPGTVGDRSGNICLQNSDLLIILGCRLNIRQISYNWKKFAEKAYKIMVDIDQTELDKPTLSIDKKICMNLNTFISSFLFNVNDYIENDHHKKYLLWCKKKQTDYLVINEKVQYGKRINPYIFLDKLFNKLNKKDTVVTGNGSACVISFQVGRINKNFRLFTNSGCASMGYDLPAAIGAFIGSKNRVICIAGDGSIMMNLQELETARYLKTNLKIFILNNNGYHSIRQTQKNFFDKSKIGVDKSNGISFPNFNRISDSFKIPNMIIKNLADIKSNEFKRKFSSKSISIFNVFLDENIDFAPKLLSKKLPNGKIVSPSLDNMFPFLADDEMKNNVFKP